MKYCIYCGHEVEPGTKRCPFCEKDISDESVSNFHHSNVKCINCNSKNVDYEIITFIKDDMVCEEQRYTCKNCGRKFNDKNRLGASFNNNPQIILSNVQKKIVKWCLILLIACVFISNSIEKKENQKKEENNWIKLDCTGLKQMTFGQIKKDSQDNYNNYIGNSYIFTTTILEIDNNKILTPVEIDDYSGSVIKFNKTEIQKLSNFKKGDKITFCGTINEITSYHEVHVINSTIIE